MYGNDSFDAADRDEDWGVGGTSTVNKPIIHRFLLTAVRVMDCPPLGVRFREGDSLITGEMFKYGKTIMLDMFEKAELQQKAMWSLSDGPMGEFCV